MIEADRIWASRAKRRAGFLPCLGEALLWQSVCGRWSTSNTVPIAPLPIVASTGCGLHRLPGDLPDAVVRFQPLRPFPSDAGIAARSDGVALHRSDREWARLFCPAA